MENSDNLDNNLKIMNAPDEMSIIQKYMPLVNKVSNKYSGGDDVVFEDFVSEAVTSGIMYALRKFDPRKLKSQDNVKTNLHMYICSCVEWAVISEKFNNERLIRVPKNWMHAAVCLAKIYNLLESIGILGQKADDIALEWGTKIEGTFATVQQEMDTLKQRILTIAKEIAKIKGNDGFIYGKIIKDKNLLEIARCPEHIVGWENHRSGEASPEDLAALTETLDQIADTVGERDFEMVVRKAAGYTMKEIGKEVGGVSKQRVEQRLKRSRSKIRKRKKEKGK